VCTWCASVQAESAQAQSGQTGAQNERLQGLSEDDLARIAPELARGPVALVEFSDTEHDKLPAINVAVPVHASAQTVLRVLTEPLNYPRFMPVLDKVEIVAKHDNATVYDWAWNLALLHMRGRNVMTVYPAPENKPTAAARITVDSQEGDLGRGRYLYRIHPRGADCLLVLSLRLDLREANFVARQVAKAARSVNRSGNLALGVSMALHSRTEAERRENHAQKPSAGKAPELHRPELDIPRMAPLLNRGDLLLFETSAQELQQIGVIGAIAKDEAKVQSVMHDAKSFGSSLIPGSHATVISQHDATTTFDWGIDVPLIGVSGQMQLLDQGKKLRVDATQGALKGGRWWFETTHVNPETTVVTGWARFDLKNSTWLMEQLVSKDAFLGHGMVGAAELMLMRAIRSHAYK
jgi:hypothetical protein